MNSVSVLEGVSELTDGDVDLISGANNQAVYSAGLTLAVGGIGITATGAGAGIGLVMGFGGVFVMLGSWFIRD